MKGNSSKIKLLRILLAVAISLMLSYSCKKVSGNVYDLMNLNSNFSCEAPTVVLGNGANSTSTIYENSTSATITINATSSLLTYNYSLNITNNGSSLWETKLECFETTNTNRVNTTIVLHNDSTSSEQIYLNGSLSQTDNCYNLTINSTIYIGVMNLVENFSEGATVLQVYLRMRIPDTTTYTLYIVTIKFT